MRLIFIRHGDPDYSIDNLTEKGKREVKLLTDRVCNWFKNPEDLQKAHFYSSPLGRAIATGKPSMDKLGVTPVIYDWLKEFNAERWDLLPDFFNSNEDFFDKNRWMNTDFMKQFDTKNEYNQVCNGIDTLLQEFGYIRNEKGFYDVKNPVPNHNWSEPIEKYHLKSVKDDYPQEETLVFFCHLGVEFTILSHLVNMSPMILWQGFYVSPTSITILNSEERVKGQTCFRVERLGDTNHLTNGGERLSSSGYFATTLNEIN